MTGVEEGRNLYTHMRSRSEIEQSEGGLRLSPVYNLNGRIVGMRRENRFLGTKRNLDWRRNRGIQNKFTYDHSWYEWRGLRSLLGSSSLSVAYQVLTTLQSSKRTVWLRTINESWTTFFFLLERKTSQPIRPSYTVFSSLECFLFSIVCCFVSTLNL